MIYLDNAATTLPKPSCVVEAVAAAMVGFGNSGRGAHGVSLAAGRVIYETRTLLAEMFGCARGDHVAFTANSTEALNIAISGLLGPGDHVISTDWEHNSVLRPLYRLGAQGGAVDFLPADARGSLDLADLEKRLRPETRAVVCTHASNVTGDVMDIDAVGAFCHANGLLLILDASQTAGSLPIHMARQHIDVVCFTGHKSLLGPQGTGGLCLREGLDVRPWKVGGTGIHSFSESQPPDYPTRLEAGTLNGHGIAGLHAALGFLRQAGPLLERELALADRFYRGVQGLPGVTVYGDFTRERQVPMVTLNLGDADAATVSDALAERFGVATRPGAHCAPRLHRALGTAEQGAVRFSWSWANTEAETDEAIAAVTALAAEVEPCR